MNNIIQTIRHAARAATVLLLALLAAQTAWAQMTVSNADDLAWAFLNTNVSEINVTKDITGVGDLHINHDLTINLNGHTISGDGLYFEVDPGRSLTINEEGQDGSVGNIIRGYADEPAINSVGGTVTLSNVNITTNYAYAINAGTLNIGNNVSFNGWTQAPFNPLSVNNTGNYNYDPENYNPLANIVATVTVESKTHYFENSGAALAYIAKYPDKVEAFTNVDDFSLSGTTYTIHTATGWDAFCYLLANSDKGFFDDKTVQLGADIGTADDPVTSMAGASGKDFTGTFDGQGHTLTVGYGTADAPFGEQYAAPFRYIEDGCTIKNLHVAGHIYTAAKFAGGLIAQHWGTVNVENCRVSTVIHSSVSGDGTHGGFVATGSGTATIEGCLFDGVICTTASGLTNSCGGFVGWRDGTVNISNSLYAPAAVPEGRYAIGTDGCATFARNGAGIANSYYTQTLGDAQGKACHSVTAGTDVTVAHAGVATHYATSGITAYKATGASADSDPFIAGLLYNNNVVDVLYAGSGDEVSLTLTNSSGEAPLGYYYPYSVSAGTLSGSTLTMPDEDVTVSVNTAALRSTGVAVPVSYVDAGGNTQTAQAIALDGTETGTDLGRLGEETWYFVGLPTVAFDRLDLLRDINLILADGCTMNVTSTDDRSCINVKNNLHIYGQAEGTGILNAQKQVGILSSDVIIIEESTLGIHGGNVIATYNGTAKNVNAIYFGRQNTAGDVLVIDGGTLTANGNDGYGIFIDGGDARINGGQVTATGGNSGIAVSSKAVFLYPKIPGTLTLSGGTLTASSIKTFSGMDTEGTIAVAPGYTYTDGSNIYDSATASATLDALTKVTLQPCLAANLAPDGNYWTTYYNGATGFTIDKNENACAYTATYGDGKLTLHNLGKQIPAGTAVIIVADNSVVSMTATDLPAYSGTNDLCGVDVDTDVDDIRSDLGEGTLYVLGMTTVDNEQHFGFHRYTGEEMAAHKAFVHVGNSQAPARSLTMVFDDATGIESAEADSSLFTLHSSLSTWFTLDGRRLQAKPTAPGIYINNGKKVVIK